jgi:predicted RNA-binding Zn-ribbon protein involved in translation (DUF1610 family)
MEKIEKTESIDLLSCEKCGNNIFIVDEYRESKNDVKCKECGFQPDNVVFIRYNYFSY